MGSALSENLARLRKTRDPIQEALAATAGPGVDSAPPDHVMANINWECLNCTLLAQDLR